MPGGDDQLRIRRDSQRRPPQSQAQRAKAFKKEFSRIRRSRGWLAKRKPGELLALMLEMLPPASFIDPLTGSPKTWEKELRRALAGRLKDTVVIPKPEWPRDETATPGRRRLMRERLERDQQGPRAKAGALWTDEVQALGDSARFQRDQGDQDEIARVYRGFMAGVPEKDRRLLDAWTISQTTQEAADLVGVQRHTVEDALARARDRAKRLPPSIRPSVLEALAR